MDMEIIHNENVFFHHKKLEKWLANWINILNINNVFLGVLRTSHPRLSLCMCENWKVFVFKRVTHQQTSHLMHIVDI